MKHLLLLLLPFAALAQTLPLRLDLEQAEQLALEHSPLLLEARARVRGLDAAADEIRTLGLPRLDAVSSLSYDGNPSSGGPDGDSGNESWRAGLNLNVPLYSFGRIHAGLDQARASALAAFWDAERVRGELRLGIRERYLRAQFADRAVKVQESSIALLEQQVSDNQSRLEAGMITRLPLLQSRVALENGRTALLRARRDRTLALEALRASIGLPYPANAGPDQLELPESWPVLPVSALSPAEARAQAENTRPDLRRFAEERRSQEAAREVIRFTRRPDLSGFVNAGFENDRFGEDDVRETWIFGVQISMPLYEGGQRDQRIAQLDARLTEIRAREQGLLLQIDTQLREAFTELDLSEALLAASTGLIEQAEEALRLATEAQANGRATQLDVSQAELELTRARLEQHAAEHDLLRARARILYVIGE